jgi:hypothetical protein
MSMLESLAARDRQDRALGRHSVMLASLVLLLIALPFLEWVPGGGTRFPLLLCLVLLAAIYVNRTQRWILWIAIALGSATLVGLAIGHSSGSTCARIIAELLGLGLLGFTTLVLLNSLLRSRDVHADTLVGGVCVYLLIGLCFAMIYRLLIDFSPGSFVSGGEALVASPGDASSLSTQLLYFSVVTLTTVGYGDITPRGDLAQMFSSSEALLGQLYLAIFIARMMGLYMGSDRARERVVR